MSHIVTVKTELKNIDTIKKVCKNMGLKYHGKKNVKYYNTVKSGIAINLNGWKYPIAVQNDGSVYYDNYNGNWGQIHELNKFIDEYSLVETVNKIEQKHLKYEVKRFNNEIRVEVFV